MKILQATDVMHKNSVIHKDLKAENILVDSELGKLKIIDFGTAQSQFEASEITADIIYGTPYYNAPEAILAEFTSKTDMWAIGTILYTMLCGFPPFAGTSDKKIMSLIENGEIDFDETYWRDRSDLVKDFIKSLIDKDEDKRLTAEAALKHPWITKTPDVEQIPEVAKEAC